MEFTHRSGIGPILRLFSDIKLPYAVHSIVHGTKKNEKALGETQTLCAGCSKAEQKNFAPPLGVRDSQNLISWRWSLPLPTDPVW